MKRFLRRTVAIVVGLSLGWYVAGQYYAHGAGSPEERPAATHPAVESAASTQPGEAAEHGERESSEAAPDGHEAAERLAPAPTDIPFMKPVIIGAALLFAAAAVLGSLALKVRGPEPVEPVAHDDEHQQHFEPGHGPSEHPTRGVLEAEKHDHGHGH